MHEEEVRLQHPAIHGGGKDIISYALRLWAHQHDTHVLQQSRPFQSNTRWQRAQSNSYTRSLPCLYMVHSYELISRTVAAWCMALLHRTWLLRRQLPC
jgi:hypothetical protein